MTGTEIAAAHVDGVAIGGGTVQIVPFGENYADAKTDVVRDILSRAGFSG